MNCKDKLYPVSHGDTGIGFSDHLMIDGESVDLTGASIGAYLQAKDGTQLVENGTTAILQTGDDQDRTEPNILWMPEEGDLETLGIHDFKWKVTLPNSSWFWYPRGKAYQIEVHANPE